MKYWLVVFALVAPVCAHAGVGDGVAAVVSYESERLGADGVWKQTRMKERFYRQGDHVWVERVLPPNAPALPRDDHQHGHERKGLETAARHITRAAKGEANLQFVMAREKTIVSVRKDDMPAVGFHGEWDSAYHIIKPSVIKSMRRTGQAANAPDGVWYEKDTGSGISKILWSEKLGLPLRIETRDKNGSAYNRITVETERFPGADSMPWKRLPPDYRVKEYSDLLD